MNRVEAQNTIRVKHNIVQVTGRNVDGNQNIRYTVYTRLQLQLAAFKRIDKDDLPRIHG